MRGAAPAHNTNVRGRYSSMSRPAVAGSAASAVTAVKLSPSSLLTSSRCAPVRATPTTCAPAADSAAAMPRPNPRLAPVTIAVVPARAPASSMGAGLVIVPPLASLFRTRSYSLSVLKCSTVHHRHGLTSALIQIHCAAAIHRLAPMLPPGMPTDEFRRPDVSVLM